MFDADRPIIKSSQDRLNRTTFAKYLARCMLDHNDPESLVVGLYGGWGVGKTSLINLIREELEFAATNLEDPDKPIILNFSAWSYSGQNQLIYSFFRRFSATLRGVDYLKNSDRIIYLLELYISFFTHQPVPNALREKRSLWEKMTFQDRESFIGWESGRDLTQVKAELNALLSQQNHKIIIIIDNISRLYDYEVKQIFQIVKSIGDFANTAYLLAFDKELVINMLNQLDGSGGEEYVEKIVQLPFDIPPIQQQDLEAIFADRLGEVMKLVPEDTWNAEYWADIYYSSLKLFFENCRDITRYVNTLNFSYSRLRDLVNPVDFFALTAIEVFIPDIYFGIRENKDLFTDLLDNVYVIDKEQTKRDRVRCDEILMRNNKIPTDKLLDLLMRLFPRIRRIYLPNVDFHYSEATARKLRRICSLDLFDIYFRLSMQVGQLPKLEFETMLATASDPTAFDHALVRLNQDGKIIQFLDSMDVSVLEEIPKENIQAIVSGLLDNGDLFPLGVPGPLNLDTHMRIHRIIHSLFQRLHKSDDRFLVIKNAISEAEKSLFILTHELKEQGREHLENSDEFLPPEYRDLTPEQLTELKKIVITKIQEWARDDRLIEHPRLLPILFAWRDWGNGEDVREYVAKITETDKGLIAFLTGILDKPIEEAMTEYHKNASWEKYIEDITSFIAPEQLEPHAQLLFEDPYFEKLREKEQLALMIFLDLLKSSAQKVIPKTSG